MFFVSVLMSLLAAGASPPAKDAVQRCEAIAERYLVEADAANRLQALKSAEDEIGYHDIETSARLGGVRGQLAVHYRMLLAAGCSAPGFAPAYSLYLPLARACARFKSTGERVPDFEGCEPFAWRARL